MGIWDSIQDRLREFDRNKITGGIANLMRAGVAGTTGPLAPTTYLALGGKASALPFLSRNADNTSTSGNRWGRSGTFGSSNNPWFKPAPEPVSQSVAPSLAEILAELQGYLGDSRMADMEASGGGYSSPFVSPARIAETLAGRKYDAAIEALNAAAAAAQANTARGQQTVAGSYSQLGKDISAQNTALQAAFEQSQQQMDARQAQAAQSVNTNYSDAAAKAAAEQQRLGIVGDVQSDIGAEQARANEAIQTTNLAARQASESSQTAANQMFNQFGTASGLEGTNQQALLGMALQKYLGENANQRTALAGEREGAISDLTLELMKYNNDIANKNVDLNQSYRTNPMDILKLALDIQGGGKQEAGPPPTKGLSAAADVLNQSQYANTGNAKSLMQFFRDKILQDSGIVRGQYNRGGTANGIDFLKMTPTRAMQIAAETAQRNRIRDPDAINTLRQMMAAYYGVG